MLGKTSRQSVKSEMRKTIAAAMMALCLWPACAHAKWREAQSDHFVVFADQSEKDILRFSEFLERYHAAMALLLERGSTVPSPSNRVTVFVVGSDDEVRKLHGGKSDYVGGFYIPRPGGSLAIVPKVISGTGDLDWSMVVLLHEYAHHFLVTSSAAAYPRWFNEGAAEFFASSRFGSDGGISIGRAAQHRAYELFSSRDVTAEELLDPAVYETNHGKSKQYDAFYGRSWLLYHYLTFDKGRAGQLRQYLQLLQNGLAEREAGQQAFGDFDILEDELEAYLKARRMLSFQLAPDKLTIGPVKVRELREGEAAIMPVRIRSRRGVDEQEAVELLDQARALAARYPADPQVLSALAECERDAGHNAEAIAAADAALAQDSGAVDAYVQKGLALFDVARDAPDEEQAAAYRKATAPFLALNKVENDHPLPLYHFYLAQVEQGKRPSPLAVDALDRALQLAPFDLGLRMTLGTTLIQLGKRDLARLVLKPAAASAHASSHSEAARKLLARLDADPSWSGENIDEVTASHDADEEPEQPDTPAQRRALPSPRHD